MVTFHGLVGNAPPNPELLDHQIHTRMSVFEEACEHLARNYNVVSASSLLRARETGESLPDRSVVITFDDGFESNYKLAYPVLRRLGLKATIFVVSGYLDQQILPWFVRLEMALSRTQEKQFLDLPLETYEQRQQAYFTLCKQFKDLPATEGEALILRAETELKIKVHPGDDLPESLRPMTWDMAREMQESGVIEIGGHTHTHPVLGRCDEAQTAYEIRMSQERITAELGHASPVFAYPNGRPTDFGPVTQRLLRESGFRAAFTMVDSFVTHEHDLLALPRYGSPDSSSYLEAMVSGTMQRLREARQMFKPRSNEKEAAA